MLRRALAVLACGSVVFLSCKRLPPPPTETVRPDLGSELARLWERYADRGRTADVDGMLALLSDDYVQYFEGFPSLDRAGWEAFARGWFQTGTIQSMTVQPLRTLSLESHAVQIGPYVESYQERGSPVRTDYGRISIGYERGADGSWKIAWLVGFVDSTVTAK